MIRSFRCRETERLHRRLASRRFRGIERVALRRLAQLNAAVELRDLAASPGNRLEKLRGDREGHSMRINEQWRICFVWRDGDACEVEIVDYHS